MKELPILFSAPMVRAILEGRKTQTRRIVSPQPVRSLRHVRCVETDGHCIDIVHPPGWRWRDTFAADEGGDFAGALQHRCPYGEPGDRLWVRETWAAPSDYDDLSPKSIDAMHTIERVAVPLWYAATDTTEAETYTAGRWRPSIHCPRWASRITLRVTSVRAEQLQAITSADARAEGCEPRGDGRFANSERSGFAALWDAINGARASWESNPWVWVVGFERVEATP